MTGNSKPQQPASLRTRLHEIVFEADTSAGKAFDVLLLWAITASVVAVCLESVQEIRNQHGTLLLAVEWFFTILFSIEYCLRLWLVDRPGRYARSFFGIIDLMAVLPTYASLLFPGAQALLVIRGLRLLRIFRVLKLARYVQESRVLVHALRASSVKILVFLYAVLTMVVIFGALMYLIEGAEHGFTSIPRGIYWAIVTMTTVGYGDIAPSTVLGQAVAAVIMILGYGIIAVPTGIVSVELAATTRRMVSTQSCPGCGVDGHDSDARHCKWCGAAMESVRSPVTS